jgi:hypothetical protein
MINLHAVKNRRNVLLNILAESRTKVAERDEAKAAHLEGFVE